jgi:hypothetical protein
MSDDPKKKSSSHDPSRRKFLKGVGVAGAGAALADSLLSHDLITAKAKSDAADTAVSGNVTVELDINSKRRTALVEPRTTLLSTMRDQSWSVTWVLAARAPCSWMANPSTHVWSWQSMP